MNDGRLIASRDFVNSRFLVSCLRKLVRRLSMTATPAGPLFLDPKRLLLDMAREHTLPDLLRLGVGRLAESPRVALARIWLVRPSADCCGCPMVAECSDRSECLHLVASNGRSAT